METPLVCASSPALAIKIRTLRSVFISGNPAQESISFLAHQGRPEQFLEKAGFEIGSSLADPFQWHQTTGVLAKYLSKNAVHFTNGTVSFSCLNIDGRKITVA